MPPNRRYLERLFERGLLTHFGRELSNIIAAAQENILLLPDTAELERLLFPYIQQAAMIGVTEALDPIVQFGIGFDPGLYNRAAVEFARQHIATVYDIGLASAINRTSREAVQAAVSNWLQTGDRIEDLRTILEPTFGRRRAETIAVTEVTNAISGGNITGWQAVNKELGAQVIIGKQWSTANDERVCPICAPLGGLLFSDGAAQPTSIDAQQRRGISAGLSEAFIHPGGSGMAGRFADHLFVRPPAHANCRCTLKPVIGEMK